MKQWRKAKQNKPARQEAEALAISKENKSTHAILIALIFLPCLILTLHLDNDLWFLLNSGRYVLQHGIPAKAAQGRRGLCRVSCSANLV